MKVGDLVKIKKEGLSLNAVDMFLGHTGVIVGVRKAHRALRKDRYEHPSRYTEFSVMINEKIARFLPRHLEVISEIR